jgi:hypothetical protein
MPNTYRIKDFSIMDTLGSLDFVLYLAPTVQFLENSPAVNMYTRKSITNNCTNWQN